MRSLLDILNERVLKYGEVFLSTSVSIDESMMPYYGGHPQNSSSVADLFARVTKDG